MASQMYKFLILDTIGVFFLILGIIAMATSMYNQNPTQILWACYLGMIIIGIGILTKRSYIIMSQVYILAIPLLVWDIDFVYWIIFQKPLWGITDYFFLNSGFAIWKVVTLQHLFTVPLSIYATKLIGLKRKDAWIWSFFQVTIVYILISLLSDPEININCVFNPCINVYFGLPYRLTWFLIFFTMIFVTAAIINRVPFLYEILEKHDMETKK